MKLVITFWILLGSVNTFGEFVSIKDNIFVGAGLNLHFGNFDSYNNNVSQYMNSISSSVISNSSTTNNEIESATSISLLIGSKVYEKEEFYIDGSISYFYYSTQSVTNTSSSGGVKLWSIDSSFSGNIFMLNGDIYKKGSDIIDFGLGLGLGYGWMTLEEKVDLNQEDWTWNSSLRGYDNSTYTFNGGSPIVDLALKAKLRAPALKSLSLVSSIGYRFFKIDDMKADESNYQSSGGNYQDINGKDLEFDFGGAMITLGLVLKI